MPSAHPAAVPATKDSTGAPISSALRFDAAARQTALVAAVALLVRVWHLIELTRFPWFRVFQMDARVHVEWAERLVRDGFKDPGPFFRAPVYPYFLAVLRTFTGELAWSARIVQIALGVLTVALAHRIALRLLPARWALAAGLMTALLWTSIHYETELLLEPLLTFLTVLLLFLMVRQEGAPSKRVLVLWGVLGGLAAAVRPNIALFLPALPIYAAVLTGAHLRAPQGARLRALARPAARAAGICLIGAVLPIAPIWAHNAREGDPGTLLAWQGGINFYIGNNPAANGWSAVAPGMRTDWQGGFEDAIRLAQERSGRRLRPSEVSDYWSREGMRYWRDHPGGALRLLALKSVLFWSNTEIKNNEDPRFYRMLLASIRWIPISFGLLAPAALAGLLLSLREDRRRRLLAVFVLAWCASIVPFFVCARYRLPVTPLLPIFALLFVRQGTAWIRSRRRVRAAAWGAAVLALYPFLWTPRAGTASGGFFQAWCNLGDAYAEQGRWTPAETAYRKSIALDPTYINNYNNLGLVLEEQDRLREAEESYRQGLAQQPRHPVLRKNLALVLQKEGRLDQAETVAAALAGDHPDAWDLRVLLCGIQEARGETALAMAGYADVVSRAPRALPARLRMARLQAASGDTTGAIGTIEQGLRLDPGRPELRQALTALQGRKGLGN